MLAGQCVLKASGDPTGRLALLVTNLRFPRIGSPQARHFKPSCTDRGLIKQARLDQCRHMVCPARAQVQGTVCATDSTDYVPTDAVEGGTPTQDLEHKVLFVCLGNICRSPSAEAVFKSVINKAGLSSSFHIDSCGTGGGNPDWYKKDGWSYHMGHPADERMITHAASRNMELTSKSRPLVAQDMIDYDYIIAMDPSNVAEIQIAADHWIVSEDVPEDVPRDYRKKIKTMTSFLRNPKYKGKYDEVPDPYFGGEQGFELVLDLLEDACDGLLADVHPRGSKPLVA